MSLLDVIKEKTKKESISSSHPVMGCDFETKFNYLKGLALFVVIDEKIADEEKSFLKELMRVFNCADLEEQLDEFLENPDINELDGIIKAFNDNKIASLFLLDALLIAYSDNQYGKEEKELLRVFKSKLDLLDIEVEYLEKFAQAINEKNYPEMVDIIHRILKEESVDLNIRQFEFFFEDFERRKVMDRIVKQVIVKEGYIYPLFRGRFAIVPGHVSTPSPEIKIVCVYGKITEQTYYDMLIRLFDSAGKYVKVLDEDLILDPKKTEETLHVSCSLDVDTTYNAEVYLDGKLVSENEFKVLEKEPEK